MDFVFMLTRADQTIADCLDVFEYIRPLNLKHIGFKDVGVNPDVLLELNRRIKSFGATSYMEVVSTSKEACYRSAKIAVDIGIDRLLGGTEVDKMLEILKGSKVEYLPFPGKPFDHPTKLAGSARDVENHCKLFLEKGCAGADLLAYRATESDPLDLVKAARRGLGTKGYLLCAGSVNNQSQIRSLKEAGCDAFTIGSAAFDGSFSPLKGSLRSQLDDIIAAVR